MLPYIYNISERLANTFKKYSVTSVMKPINTIRNILVHPKDKIPRDKASGVVYKIECSNCPESYVGETGREYKARKKEHKADVDKHSKVQYTRAVRKTSQSEYNRSDIADHVNRKNHVMNWDKDNILAKESDKQKRLIKEAICIRRNAPTMNRDQGAYQLSNTYNFLLM